MIYWKNGVKYEAPDEEIIEETTENEIISSYEERIEERIKALETSVAQNTQDISDNTDAIAELGELIGGDTVG